MTNEELFARQLHNLNQAMYTLAGVLRSVVVEHCKPPLVGALELPPPQLSDLDRGMQSFHDTLEGLKATVQKANSTPHIILPN